jgi:hypothetical protein
VSLRSHPPARGESQLMERVGCGGGRSEVSFLILTQGMDVAARGAESQQAEPWIHVGMSHQNGVHSLVFLFVGD